MQDCKIIAPASSALEFSNIALLGWRTPAMRRFNLRSRIAAKSAAYYCGERHRRACPTSVGHFSPPSCDCGDGPCGAACCSPQAGVPRRRSRRAKDGQRGPLRRRPVRGGFTTSAASGRRSVPRPDCACCLKRRRSSSPAKRTPHQAGQARAAWVRRSRRGRGATPPILSRWRLSAPL